MLCAFPDGFPRPLMNNEGSRQFRCARIFTKTEANAISKGHGLRGAWVSCAYNWNPTMPAWLCINISMVHWMTERTVPHESFLFFYIDFNVDIGLHQGILSKAINQPLTSWQWKASVGLSQWNWIYKYTWACPNQALRKSDEALYLLRHAGRVHATWQCTCAYNGWIWMELVLQMSLGWAKPNLLQYRHPWQTSELHRV